MFCDNCGNKIETGMAVCPSCGKVVGKTLLEPSIRAEKDAALSSKVSAKIWASCIMIWVFSALSFVGLVFNFAELDEEEAVVSSAEMLIGFLLLVAMVASPIVNLWVLKAKVWARNAVTAMLGINIVEMFVSILEESSIDVENLIWTLIFMSLPVLSIVFLWSKEANGWFKR